MAGDFRVTDVTTETEMFSVQGRDALTLGQRVFGGAFSDLPRDGAAETKLDGIPVTLIRASHTAEDGFDIIVDATHGKQISQAFLDAGAVLVGSETFETLRIEAGIGRFNQDMDETNVVTEANLDDAVSFTKGCYIGQEIIARIKYRGHVAKKLTGIVANSSEPIAAGSTITTLEGKDIGRVTSATFSPVLDRTVALAYVRHEHLAAGTTVVIGESKLSGKVTELPFVRGSWYS